MSDKPTSIVKLRYICGTPLARCYENEKATHRQWVPRSVCPEVFKHGDKSGDMHDVTIEDWWLTANPWEKKDGKEQRDLFS